MTFGLLKPFGGTLKIKDRMAFGNGVGVFRACSAKSRVKIQTPKVE